MLTVKMVAKQTLLTAILLAVSIKVTHNHYTNGGSASTAACVRQCQLQGRTSTCRGRECYTQQQQAQSQTQRTPLQQRQQIQQQTQRTPLQQRPHNQQQSPVQQRPQAQQRPQVQHHPQVQQRPQVQHHPQFEQRPQVQQRPTILQQQPTYPQPPPQQRPPQRQPQPNSDDKSDSMGKVMQNLTATFATMLTNKINVHVTHDYKNSMSESSAEEVKPMLMTTNTKVARDCNDILDQGHNKSGIYIIGPEVYPVNPSQDEMKSYMVYCDMDTDGGGWTVFQRRFNGLVDFYRDWEDYKHGFGYLMGDHWLGLERVHLLTSTGHYELRIDLVDYYGHGGFAIYDKFQIGDEGTSYTLVVGDYKGTAGDSLTYHNHVAFSTKDKDNDKHASHCALKYKGAWWYKDCFRSNLNGVYLRSLTDSSVMNWHDTNDALKASEMKLRRVRND